MNFTKWMLVPVLGAGWVGAKEVQIDAVAAGKKVFESVGCSECHTVTKGDTSFKTGPNLFGLLLTQPRDRQVMVNGKETTVKADRAYFERSIRKSPDELAVSETEPTKGTAYLPIMPSYEKNALSDDDLESVWHYLRTLADEGQNGPAKVMVKRKEAAQAASIIDVPNEEIVTNRDRVIRAPIQGSSARSLHVGQANGVSYTFDPRMLSVRKVWTGGFLNLSEERNNRGNNLSVLGRKSQLVIQGTPLLQPLTASGKPVDFEFKEPDAQDDKAIERHLWDKKDFAESMAEMDSDFLGHRLASGTGAPVFRFRVGKNTFNQSVSIGNTGAISITLEGELKEAQRFQVRADGWSNVRVSGGELKDNQWSLAAGAKGPFKLEAQIAIPAVPREKLDREENWAPQKLVTQPAKGGKKPLELQAGYSVEDWLPPVDLLGRNQLFEATGIAVAKDGTIVLATRAAGVWRIRNGQWSLFAEGIYEALGVHIEDDKGDVIVIAQKPELTRIRDVDGDGRADDFQTVTDDFGFHGNYHEYTHGPVRDAAGNYYFLLNLAHHKDNRVSWRAGGRFMGSMGGYRGWALRVTPDGKTETFAHGLRSPAGLGVAPDGTLWYAENQGEYCGSSKLVPLEKDKFYAHPSGLESLPGMLPDSPELNYDLWKDKARKPALWLPHAMMANSPGNPAWDLTNGKFGIYQGQMFIGDQTLSKLLRVVTEQVDGEDQGCVIPFVNGLASGIMRPVFLPDGSLLLGQTGRGWKAVGGNNAALQRVVYDGKTVPTDIHKITAAPTGFEVHFTQPIDSKVTTDQLKAAIAAESWSYNDRADYGSPKIGTRVEEVASVTLSADRKSVLVDLKDFGNEGKWTGRLYHLQFKEAATLFGNLPVWKSLEGFYTLNAIPKKK